MLTHVKFDDSAVPSLLLSVPLVRFWGVLRTQVHPGSVASAMYNSMVLCSMVPWLL